jgi:phospholipid/cholesterol/gamma-HCH transport system ATP-binding protein
VSFEVKRAEVFAILGGSGSGKSTLMKQMIGLHRPDSGGYGSTAGTLWRPGVRNGGHPAQDRGMYQSGALFGSMTLLENVRLPLEEFTDLPTRHGSCGPDEAASGGAGRAENLMRLN